MGLSGANLIREVTKVGRLKNRVWGVAADELRE